MPYHLCACCDGSFLAATNEAGIGVSVLLVNHENMSETHPLLYAWKKTNAKSPDIAELEAIRFACFCLDRDDVKRRVDELGGTGDIQSGAVRNDCQTVVQTLSNSPSFGRVQEIFRGRYACELSIEWECNHGHRKKGCMAVVDQMAKAAGVELQLGETVYAENANGLRDRVGRTAEVNAFAASVRRTEFARPGAESAGMAAGSDDADPDWNGRGMSMRPELFGRNSETGAFRRAHVGDPPSNERDSQPCTLGASEGGSLDVHALD